MRFGCTYILGGLSDELMHHCEHPLLHQFWRVHFWDQSPMAQMYAQCIVQYTVTIERLLLSKNMIYTVHTYVKHITVVLYCEYNTGEQQYLKQSTRLRNMWKSGGLVGWRKSPR